MKKILYFLLTSSFFFSCNEETKNSAPNTDEVVKIMDSLSDSSTTAQTLTTEEDSIVNNNNIDTASVVAETAPKIIPHPKQKPKLPNIKFDETNHYFGNINQGDIVKHNFKFTNTGEAALQIKNVTASCGCTQPSFPFIDIPPGESGEIGVSFNSTGKIGAQKPELTVITNARGTPFKIYLNGTVLEPKKTTESPQNSEKQDSNH